MAVSACEALRALESWQDSPVVARVAGVEWRLRRPTSEDLLRAGEAVLLAVPGAGSTRAGQAPPKGEARALRLTEALVCAAVEGVRLPGAEAWEPLRLVRSEREEGPAVRWVQRYPVGVINQLAAAVQAGASEGAAAEAVATFLASRSGVAVVGVGAPGEVAS